MGRVKVCSAFVLALASATAAAHVGMHGPGAQYDADKNGVLSLGEYTAYLKAAGRETSNAPTLFASADLNKDGGVSGAEFTASLRKSSAGKTAP